MDGANVVGSRPDGWWRDRPGAAARLVERLRTAAPAGADWTVVLEGAARQGAVEGGDRGVRVRHAQGSGDDLLAALAAKGSMVVTADRVLADRCRAAGARVVSPRRLLDLLDRLPGESGQP